MRKFLKRLPLAAKILLGALATLIGLVAVAAALLVLWIATTPPGVHTAEFRSADDRGTLQRDFDADVTVPLFVIDGGRLYLKTQSVQAVVVAMAVDTPTWDVEAVAALKRQHPEILAYLPDPNAANGGIPWIPITPASPLP